MDVEPGNRVTKDQLLELVDSPREQYTARRRPSRRLIRRPHCLRGAGRSAEHLGAIEEPGLLGWNEWQRRRASAGGLPRGPRGEEVARRETHLWKAAMRQYH